MAILVALHLQKGTRLIAIASESNLNRARHNRIDTKANELRGHCRAPWLTITFLVGADELCVGQHMAPHRSLHLGFGRAF